MRKTGIILVALVIGFALGVGVQGAQVRVMSFLNGNEYLSKQDSFKLGYVAGASDAFCLDLGQSGLSKFKRGRSVEMTIGQIRAITDKYLQETPQDRHLAMASLVYEAVVKACPE